MPAQHRSHRLRRTSLSIEQLEDRTAPAVTLITPALPGGPYTPNGPSQTIGASSISADGQRVVFSSAATDITPTSVPLGFGGGENLFLWDRATESTQMITVDSTGELPAGGGVPKLSANGRFVAFQSSAIDLVPGFRNNNTFQPDIFLRDTDTQTTELITESYFDSQSGANSSVSLLDVSEDGRYVFFQSNATNLTPEPITSSVPNIYARDRQTGTTYLVNITVDNQGASQPVYYHQFGTSGRYVVFSTATPNIVPDRTSQLYIRDLQQGVTFGIAPDSAAVERSAALAYAGLASKGLAAGKKQEISPLREPADQSFIPSKLSM